MSNAKRVGVCADCGAEGKIFQSATAACDGRCPRCYKRAWQRETRRARRADTLPIRTAEVRRAG